MNIFWHWINLAGDILPLFYYLAGRALRSAHPFLVYLQCYLELLTFLMLGELEF